MGLDNERLEGLRRAQQVVVLSTLIDAAATVTDAVEAPGTKQVDDPPPAAPE
jgi:hypothetical protein